MLLPEYGGEGEDDTLEWLWTLGTLRYCHIFQYKRGRHGVGAALAGRYI